MKRILRFAVAGGAGFLVDASILWLLLNLTQLGPFISRIAGIGGAMATTWVLNRTFTFEKSGRSVGSEGARYGLVGIIGALVNYAVYSALLLTVPALLPLAALVAASAAATLFSFFGYSRYVFRP